MHKSIEVIKNLKPLKLSFVGAIILFFITNIISEEPSKIQMFETGEINGESPFFSGLVIQPQILMPGFAVELPDEPELKETISFHSDVRRFILKMERENTGRVYNTKLHAVATSKPNSPDD